MFNLRVKSNNNDHIFQPGAVLEPGQTHGLDTLSTNSIESCLFLIDTLKLYISIVWGITF